MAKRRTVPLFDLLSRRDESASGPSSPPVASDQSGQAAHFSPYVRANGTTKPVIRLPLKPSSEQIAEPESVIEAKPAMPETAVRVETRTRGTILQPAHRHVGNTSTIHPQPHPTSAPAEHNAQSAGMPDAWASRDLRVPRFGLWILLFLSICAAFIVWGVAYKLGFDSGKQSTEGLLRRDPPPMILEPSLADEKNPTKPAKSEGMGSLGTVTPEPLDRPKTNSSEVASQTRTGTSAKQPGDIVLPQGSLLGYFDEPAFVTDVLLTNGWDRQAPRVLGLNYLWLGKMPRQDAGEAVVFLGANGIEAFATPVLDNSPRAGKDTSLPKNLPAQYKVWVGPGLSGGDLKLRKGEALEKRIEQLGQFWSKTAKKRYDFRKPLWVKFDEK